MQHVDPASLPKGTGRSSGAIIPPRRIGAALVAGFAAGNVASFVKWGTEAVFPPRTPDRPVPPLEVLRDLGLDPDALTYRYSGHLVNWGSAGIHHLFSLGFAMLYALLAERWPRVTLWQGVAFGLVVTLVFHGAVLPAGGWAPPIWALPPAELASETLGHVAWSWTIEVFRRDLRSRLTHEPDPAVA